MGLLLSTIRLKWTLFQTQFSWRNHSQTQISQMHFLHFHTCTHLARRSSGALCRLCFRLRGWGEWQAGGQKALLIRARTHLNSVTYRITNWLRVTFHLYMHLPSPSHIVCGSVRTWVCGSRSSHKCWALKVTDLFNLTPVAGEHSARLIRSFGRCAYGLLPVWRFTSVEHNSAGKSERQSIEHLAWQQNRLIVLILDEVWIETNKWTNIQTEQSLN